MQKRNHNIQEFNENIASSQPRSESENFHVQSVSAPNEKLVTGGRSSNYHQGIASQANFCSSMPSIPTANAGFARPQVFQSMNVLNTSTAGTTDNSSNIYNRPERNYVYQQNLPVNQFADKPHNFSHISTPLQNISRQYVQQGYPETHSNRPTNISSGQPSGENGKYYNHPESTSQPQYQSKVTPVYVSNIRQSASLSALTEEPSRVEPSYSLYSIPREIEIGQVLAPSSVQLQKNVGRSQDSLNNVGLSNMDISMDRKGEYVYQVLVLCLLFTLLLSGSTFTTIIGV